MFAVCIKKILSLSCQYKNNWPLYYDSIILRPAYFIYFVCRKYWQTYFILNH